MEAQHKGEVKHLADIVGEWGKWQFTLFVFCTSMAAAGALINMGYSFHAKNVDFWCNDIPQEYLPISNLTNELKCNKFNDTQEVCTEWTYNTTQFKRSIITEFDLVCDRAYYASLTQSFYMMGYIVSGFVVSHLSDKYGRKPMVLLSFSIEVLGIISCGLSVNIYQYIFSRFLVGMGSSGGGWAGTTILIECLGPKHRSDIVLLSGLGWSTGYVLLPGFAYLLQDFRYMQLISAIPMALIVFWMCFLWESPRWQITHGKADRAELTIKRALKLNGKSINNLKQQMKQLTQNIQKSSKSGELEKSHNLLDLLKTPMIRKCTFIFWYSWVANALIYYGFSFNMTDFGGNFYITFMLSGMVEVPCQLLTPLLLRVFGRKTLYSTFMFLVALSTLAIIPCEADWLKIMFALIGKYAVISSWNILAIHASEIYPTVIRNTGLAIAAVVGRIGSISAPFMGDLKASTSLAFVMILYAVLSTIGGVFGLFLPETRNRELPDTIEDTENFDSIEMKSIDKNKS